MDGRSDESGAWAAGWYSGRRALVTGGTSGIGAAVARAFLEAGAEVVVTGVSDAEVAAVARHPVLARAEARRLDVRNAAMVSGLVEGLRAARRGGQLRRHGPARRGTRPGRV